MNDPNYDDYEDFHDDGVSRFLEKVFGPDLGPDETDPCIIRNPGCRFTDRVLDYIKCEWEVEVTQYPHKIQNKVIDVIDLAKKDGMNVPNTAAKISMEVLPL